MIKFEKIPKGLTDLNQWLVWREEKRKGRPNKTPYQLNGIEAKTDDESTWTDFESVKAYPVDKFSGVGIVIAGDLFGIDLDACIRPDGSLTRWAEAVLDLVPSYCEVSPSGVGLKIFGYGAVPVPNGKTGRTFRRKLHPAVEGKTPEIAIWKSRRYFTVTGHVFRDRGTLIDCTDGVAELWGKLFAPKAEANPAGATDTDKLGKAVAAMAKMAMTDGNDGSRRLFAAACRAVAYDLTESESISAIRSYAQLHPFPRDWSDAEILVRVRDAESEQQRGEALRYHQRQQPKAVDDKVVQQEFTTLFDLADKFVGGIGTDEQAKLLSTGIDVLDSALGGGVDENEIVVIAARPSHGKTAVALQMVHSFTAQGLPCLFINEEMPEKMLGKRSVQFAAKAIEPAWQNERVNVVRDVFEHFDDRAPCYVANYCRTIENVELVVRRAVRDHGVKVVVVDYLQRLSTNKRSRYEIVTEVSSRLTAVGKELGVLLIPLAQLNRQVESRDKLKGADNKRQHKIQLRLPNMSDLRESGQIEQDSDVIVFATLPRLINPSLGSSDDYVLNIAKNRNRAINRSVIQCRFDGAHQRVESLYEDAPNPYDDAPTRYHEFDEFNNRT